jgi:hypothetical protein
MRFLIMCPRCPASATEAEVAKFSQVLKKARAEEPNHIACGGELWVVRSQMDSIKTGAPVMWRPDGEAFAWKDIEPEPLVIALPDASALRIRFPIDDGPIIEHGRPIGLN